MKYTKRSINFSLTKDIENVSYLWKGVDCSNNEQYQSRTFPSSQTTRSDHTWGYNSRAGWYFYLGISKYHTCSRRTHVRVLSTGSFAGFRTHPIFCYRAYALLRADYYIDRDSLAILWGLRVEDIPLTDIEWVRPASDLSAPLSLPRFRLPGAVIGTRRHSDLGLVEFLAADSRKMILVATSKRVFAISPKDMASLVRTFARATELGSLTPAEPKSVYPSFIITQAWESPFVRFPWVSGLILNVGLIVWVGIFIPSWGKFRSV